MKWHNSFVNGLLILLILAIAGLIFYFKFAEDLINSQRASVASHPPISLSAWVTDWDYEQSANDALIIKDNLNSIQLFLGYFNEQGELIWGKEQEDMTKYMLDSLDNENHPLLYLTIVNDIIFSDGSSSQKNSALVNQLIATRTSQYQFIETVISLIKAHNFDGLELDFENIPNEDWPKVLKFYELVNTRLAAENIHLRVVLEPKMSFEKMELPENIQYVVMAYNLYGPHSGPGPKANQAFIGKLTARLEKLPSDTIVAIATGGFSWGEDGSIKGLSEQNAVALQLRSINTTIHRDESSHTITFDYRDEKGVKHTVWYADEHALNYWIKEIQHRGYSNIAVWRMGYLSQDSLKVLNEIK